MIIYLDGRYVPEEEAKVSVFDHGLLYGDGVFEGIRAYNGRIFRLDEHLARLYDSAKTIDLAIPISKEEMAEVIKETLRRNNLRDAYIRPIVTRGKGVTIHRQNCEAILAALAAPEEAAPPAPAPLPARKRRRTAAA